MSTDCDSLHDDASDVYNEETSGCDVFNEEISNFDDAYNEQSYIVLSQADIRRRIEDDITKLSSVLSVSIIEARILLRHYNWVVSQVHEEWFADEERVRKDVGLLEKPVAGFSNATQLTCGVCFDTFPKDDVYAAACGHPYCSLCWAGYISTAINDGPGCLNLRCPEPGCPAAVGHDMVDVLGGSEDDKARYFHYFLRSYVDQNKTIKWCPAPGCEYAVHFELGSGSYDVTCRCSHSFCWNCTEEAHRPVDCDTVSKWIIKNASDSENATWIMVFSKPCPKCKRPIEKNQGCNHMACAAPCGHRFCWHCLNDLSGHSQSRCNGYQEVGEDRRKRAKMSLQRYSHYYGRWANNHSSRAKAIEELQKMQDVHLAILSDIQCVKEAQLEFIIKGWLQIVECRRVLKWTYAYGYYLQEGERAKISLFEYLQGQVEAGLERLHHCAETELQQFLNAEGPSEGFNEFRLKLINLTKVTGNYFENLVRALENGLSETDSKPVHEADHDEDVDSYWSCDRCTYINFGWAKTCEMCNALFN